LLSDVVVFKFLKAILLGFVVRVAVKYNFKITDQGCSAMWSSVQVEAISDLWLAKANVDRKRFNS
jgi:hypothetical protein